MSLDSTAELLFKINADSADAENNIARFRTLMGKDLSSMGAEFDDWASKVLGDLTTVQGAMMAGTAALAAGVVAVGVAISKATDRYDEYTDAIARGVKLTGLHAEDMSTLYLLAQKSGVAYDDLVNGLMKFSTTIVKASQGNKEAQKAFHDLGIDQKDVIAGQNDMLPLLLKTMDAFHGNASAVQRAALAREVFSRGGTSLLTMLKKGAEAFQEMKARAKEWGLQLSDQDLAAAMEYKAALKQLKAEQEGLDIAIGKATESMRIWWATAKVGVFDTLRDIFSGKGLTVQTGNPVADFFASIGVNADVAEKKIQAEIEASKNAGKLPDPLTKTDPAKIKEAATDFYGLSSVLEQINGKIAEETSGYARLNQEINRYATEALKATEELKKLHSENRISQETYQRESAALAQIPAQMVLVRRQGLQKLDAEDLKHNADQAQALEQVHRELADKLAVYDSQDFDALRAKLEKESDQLRQSSLKKADLTTAEYKLLDQIHEAGLNKIARDEQQSFLTSIEQLQQHLEQMVMENLSAKDKLGFQYQQDLRQFSVVEEAKVLALHQSSAAQETIRAFYDQIRTQSTQKYQNDLQHLINSQGWQSVFGSKFGELLRGNEAAMKQWATSANQSHDMVRLSLTALDQVGKEAFEHMADGMAAGIASSLVYSKSIGQAMEAAGKSTLEQISSMCLANAIYSMALGFERLAQYEPGSASSAFTAAAIFGSVGVGAAIAGRAIPSSQGQSAGAASAPAMPPGTGSVSASGSGGSGYGGGMSQQRTPHLTVNVYGHVVGVAGVSQLANMLNDAVLNQDVTLTATNTRSGVQVTR